MEIDSGSSRYSNIRQNAFWNNAHLDTRFHIQRENALDTMKHLQDCFNNPTRGLLARREAKGVPNYPGHYSRNEKALYNIPVVNSTNERFEKEFKKLYPRSGKARKYLIENENVVLNYVKPKAYGLKRAIFKLINRII